MNTRVKICGINSLEVAKKAKQAGADTLGFIIEVGYSKYDINRIEAKEILHHVHGETVMVTTLDDVPSLIELSDFVDTTHIQVTQLMDTADLDQLREQSKKLIIYTIHIVNAKSIELALKYEPHCDYILLDSGNKIQAGGTGETHDWEISKQIVKAVQKPIILAGGLNPLNVSEAIEIVTPYGVDVSSGVATCGKKDQKKIEEFIKKVKGEI